MSIKINAENIIDEINEFSERPLMNRFEISVIIEFICVSDNKLFKDLIFQAKYVNGLKNVISGRSINKDDYMEKLFEEFNKSLERFISLLREAVLKLNDSGIKFFDEKYFKLTHESMVNMMKLIDDLTIVKEYFNRKPKSITE
ncbi:MAG: hypothetical protein ABI792_03435 [bacterium]